MRQQVKRFRYVLTNGVKDVIAVSDREVARLGAERAVRRAIFGSAMTNVNLASFEEVKGAK